MTEVVNTKVLQRIVSIITRCPEERHEFELDSFTPWLCKKSYLLRNLNKDVLMKLLKYCDYEQVVKDHVIIRQGDKGDCFYIQLTGKTSLYIDTSKPMESVPVTSSTSFPSGADGVVAAEPELKSLWIEEIDRQGRKTLRLDRSRLGHFVRYFEAGKSFGELALITDNALRNASVVADDVTDLLVIRKQLFDETLKAKQEEEYNERKSFVDQSELFGKWMPQNKRLLEISLRKEIFPFDSHIVKQGQRVVGLYFIIRGEAKLIVDTSAHSKQYTQRLIGHQRQAAVHQSESGVTVGSNSSSSNGNSGGGGAELSRDLSGDVKQCSTLMTERVRVRRTAGYAASERRLCNRETTVCVVDSSEIIGAMELLCGLTTHAHTVITTNNTEVFILDKRNIERIIVNNRMSQTVETLINGVIAKLTARLNSTLGAQIELYKFAMEHLRQRKLGFEARSTGVDTTASTTNSSSAGKQRTVSPTKPKRQAFDTYNRSTNNDQKFDLARIFYRSKVEERSSRFNTALQRMHQESNTMTRDAMMVVTKSAKRLLPRSRRQLENLSRRNPDDAEAKTLLNPSHAIHRYSDSAPTAAASAQCARAASAFSKSDWSQVKSTIARSQSSGAVQDHVVRLLSTPVTTAAAVNTRPFTAHVTSYNHDREPSIDVRNRPLTTNVVRERDRNFSSTAAVNGRPSTSHVHITEQSPIVRRSNTSQLVTSQQQQQQQRQENRSHSVSPGPGVHYYNDDADADSISDASSSSFEQDDEYEEYEELQDEERRLGLRESVLDDGIRDAVLRLGDHRQRVQAHRRLIISATVDERYRRPVPTSKTLQQLRRRAVPPATTTHQPQPNAKTAATDAESSLAGQFDWETSDEALAAIEQKLQCFFAREVKEGSEGSRASSSVVKPLRRFKLLTPNDVPIPAGTVYVRPISRQHSNCRPVTPDPNQQRHVTRRFMVPKAAYPVACELLRDNAPSTILSTN